MNIDISWNDTFAAHLLSYVMANLKTDGYELIGQNQQVKMVAFAYGELSFHNYLRFSKPNQ